MKKFSVLFAIFFTFCHAHTPHAWRKEQKCLINVPVISCYVECSEASSRDSQGLYGHSAYIVEEIGEWALVETEDGYQGYALRSQLIPDNPRWRTSRRLCRVSSLCGMVYPIADTELPELMRLPFGARVELLDDLSDERWHQVRLADGTCGWMQRGDLEKPKTRTLDEVIYLSFEFLGRPYIWGGNSSEGFDCSGYVQTLYKQMGILLPRNSRRQVASEKLYAIEEPSLPGDLVFFGPTRISHVGLYLGNGQFIHSGAARLAIANLTDRTLLATRRLKPVVFEAEILPANVPIRDDNPVPLESLRLIKLNHWGFDGCVHNGELVVHKDVAREVVEIFGELFEQHYPIEKMLLIDVYDSDDDLACEDNNTSCFCSRPITGSDSEWSFHAYGLAIDVNTLLNPYYNEAFRTENIIGEEFLDRSLDCHGVITEEDPCYKAFTQRGWLWAGHWMEERGYVDYQHFYKVL